MGSRSSASMGMSTVADLGFRPLLLATSFLALALRKMLL